MSKTAATMTAEDFKQKLMLITPQIAEKYLEKNTGNRPVKPENVRFIAGQLRAGTWKIGPDAIAFDINDRLINGQHRLLACIETGIPFHSNVMFGLDPEAYNVIDTGQKRSGGDSLSAIGVASPQHKSAIIKTIFEIKKGKSGSKNSQRRMSLTNQMIVDFYEKNKNKVENAASTGQHVYGAPNHLVSSAAIGAFSYIFTEIDADDSTLFFEMFRLGEGLSKGNPILTLRTYLTNNASSTRKYTKLAKYGIIIDAWNAYRNKKKITRFSVKNDALPKPI